MSNEQEKAKEWAGLLNAFADGKQLQYIDEYDGIWYDCTASFSLKDIIANFAANFSFRIKPETKRIALNQQDLIDRELRKDTMRVKRSGDIHNNYFHTSYFIDEIYLSKVKLSNGTHVDYDWLAKDYAFLDGTPCYKEVENE